MKKKVLTFMLAFSILITCNISVFATPQDDIAAQNKELENQQQQIKNNNAELDQAQIDSQAIKQNIENLDFQIEQLIVKINDNKKKIAAAEADIIVFEKEIQKAEDELADEKELLNKRLKAIYVNGSDGYFEVLLNAKGVSDFFVRVENLSKIVGLDKKIVDRITAKKNEIVARKTALNDEKNKMLLLKADNEKQVDKLNDSKNQQEILMAQAKEKAQLLKSRIAESNKKIEETNALIKKIRDSIPKYNANRGAAAISSNAIVAYATNFIGCPYIWGGNGEVLTPGYMEQIISMYDSRYPREYLQNFINMKTFDCSGFVAYVFAHFGITFSGERPTTYTMVNEGTYIPKDQMEPGDIVYFGTSSDVHHVGIYVGNGCFIEAPQSRDEIKISVLDDRSDFYCARRMR